MSTTDLTGATWRTSSRSNGQASVEVADLDGGARAVRYSKNPTGPALTFTAAKWTAFTTGIRAGELD